MRIVFAFLIVGMLARPGHSADRMTGRILGLVCCAKEPAQTYALYAPSTYTPELVGRGRR